MSVTFKALENILERYPSSSEHLISALQDVQAKFNYIPPEAMTAVCDHLGVPLSRGWAVATFFKSFQSRTPGDARYQGVPGHRLSPQGRGPPG